MTGSNGLAFDPRPRLVLRVGVAGHIPGKQRIFDEAAISGGVSAFLAALAEELSRFHASRQKMFRPDPPLVRVASGLAEGADQIVSGVAARMGNGFELAAVLPFPAESCALLMPGEEGRRRFGDLIARCGPVLECTDATPPTGDRPEHEQARREAYLIQSETLIEHSDLLLAVWDGAAGKGPGGTANTVRRARDLGLPVFSIDPATGDGRWLLPGHALAMGASPLPAILERLLGVAPPDSRKRESDHAEEGDALERLGEFLEETARFDDGARTLPRLGLHGFLRKWLGGAGFGSALARLRPVRAPIEPQAGQWDEATRGLVIRSGLDAHLASRWQWADGLAIRYAELNRSSVIAVPLLGFMAVAFGLAGFVLASSGGALGYAMKASLLLLELTLLLFAYEQHFKEPRRGHWHRKQVEYRSLAELLRHERFLHVAGFGGHVARAGARAGLPDEWIGWYLRATIRELGFPGARLGPAHYAAALQRARDIEILDPEDGQLAYNRATSAECHIVEHKLHRFASGIFWWLILPVGLFGIAYVGLLAIVKGGLAPGWMAALVKAFPPVTSNLITACMALAPATIAALHSVRAQIDFEEQARRTSDTAQKLEAIAASFTAETQDGATSREKARLLLTELTETLSADLSGWSTVYRHKGPEQPG
jgi:hypothetical protein